MGEAVEDLKDRLINVRYMASYQSYAFKHGDISFVVANQDLPRLLFRLRGTDRASQSIHTKLPRGVEIIVDPSSIPQCSFVVIPVVCLFVVSLYSEPRNGINSTTRV